MAACRNGEQTQKECAVHIRTGYWRYPMEKESLNFD
jgi:hypothetical protein